MQGNGGHMNTILHQGHGHADSISLDSTGSLSQGPPTLMQSEPDLAD